MKALVTGGTGFIGSHIIDLLVKYGHSVRLFSRSPELPGRLQGKGVSIVRGDLRDAESVVDAMRGADAFYHIGELKNTSRSAAEKNIRLVERVVENLKSSGTRRFVFISSITVAGIPSSVPAKEDDRAATVLKDHYTEYKRRCEEIIRQKAGTVEYSIIRPGVVYGPGSRYLGRMIEIVRRLGPLGIPFIGDAMSLMPLVHVKDLAMAIYLAGIKQGAVNQTFNLTDGQRHTWFDFMSAITAAFNRKLRIVAVPAFIARVPALFADLFSGPFGITPDIGSYIDYVTKDVFFDNKKAINALGWNPEHADLDRGVRDMMDEMRPKR